MSSAEPMTHAGRTYVRRTAVFMGLYAVLNIAAIAGLYDQLAPLARWVLAFAVALPLMAHIWAVLDFIRNSDEFVGPLTARRFILSAGIAFGLWSGWGFAESFAAAPHLPGWLIYPLFWAAFALASALVRDTKS